MCEYACGTCTWKKQEARIPVNRTFHSRRGVSGMMKKVGDGRAGLRQSVQDLLLMMRKKKVLGRRAASCRWV